MLSWPLAPLRVMPSGVPWASVTRGSLRAQPASVRGDRPRRRSPASPGQMCAAWASTSRPPPLGRNAAFERSGTVDLGPVRLEIVHERQHVGLGGVHQGSTFGHPGTELVGDAAPLLTRGVRVSLGKRGRDPGRHEATMSLARVSQHVARERHPGSAERRHPNPGWLRLCGRHASKMTTVTPRRPRRANERRKSVQKVSAPLGAGCHAEHFTVATGVRRDGDGGGNGDDLPGLADLEAGRVEPGNTATRPRAAGSERRRHAHTSSASSSAQSRDTWLLPTPDAAMAHTRSSTARVETPWT